MANIRVTELDFDTIKENLKNFLRDQSAFTDYDFDASNLSVLVDLLAYNTHYNAVLANMVTNEMFIDTAIKRSSVVSLAKHLSYTPRSAYSAEATVDIALQNIPGNPTVATLDRYQTFTTNIDGTPFTFYNINSYVASPVNGVYTFSDVKLYEGRKLDYYYTVGAGSSPATKYIVPNQAVDTRTLQVAIQYAGTSSYSQAYTLVSNIVSLDGNSAAYYLEENTEGFYQIYFGDGVLGRNLNAGDIVKISYLISNGENGNVSTNVPITWATTSIFGEASGDRAITVKIKPSGGSAKETADDIRFNALNTYVTQNRAVTERDYASLIIANLPGARSVNVWGGEKNVPPEYGVVYLSIAPKTGYVLTDDEKDRIIRDILQPRSLVTVRHTFVDPTYSYLSFDVKATYSTPLTNRTSQQISSLLSNKITTFINTNLREFNKKFYASQLQEQLMDVDNSILSIIMTQRIQKRIIANLGQNQFTGSLYFPAKLHPGELSSTKFIYADTTGTYTVQIRDVPNDNPPNYEGTGTLKLYDLATSGILDNNLGTINYATGEITIGLLTITGYVGNITDVRINCRVQTSSLDFTPGYDEILLLDDSTSDVISGNENGISVLSVGTNS
jgi:hypothetical protein